MIRPAFYRRRFTGQVDACFLREAKSLKILIKFLRAEVLADCDKKRVAGIHQAMGEILRAMARAFVAVNFCARHVDHAVAGVGKVFRDHVFFHCRSSRDNLKNRSGLIGIRNRAVAPLRILRAGKLLIFFLRVRNLFELLRRFLVCDGVRLVWVKIPFCGHGKDAAGLHIHHNPISAFRLGVHTRLIEAFLQIVLDDFVNRKHERVALLGVICCFIRRIHAIHAGVFRRQNPPRRAGKRFVIFCLQPPPAHTVRSSESQNSGSKV